MTRGILWSDDMKAVYIEKLHRGLTRLNTAPRYVAAHTARGLLSDGRKEWDEPESVWGPGSHRPVRGKVDIRVVPEDYAADLETIDAERRELWARLAQLDKDEREVIQLAWSASKPMTVADVKQLTGVSNDHDPADVLAALCEPVTDATEMPTEKVR